MGKKFNIGANYKDGKKTKCQWKGCKPNTHSFRITYIKGGVVVRGTYRGTWDKHNSNKYPKKFNSKYFTLEGKPYMKIPINNFWFQRHHVIPVSVMKNLANISHNLKLLGWNMNNGDKNGICLPFNYEAIKIYNLQAHRGSHPNYNNWVKSELNNLESKCKDYCKQNKQGDLIKEIEDSVQDFIESIVDWSIQLHANSINYKT